MACPRNMTTLSVDIRTSRASRVSRASTMSECSLSPDDLFEQLGAFPGVPDALNVEALMKRVPSIMEDEEPWEGFASLSRTSAGTHDEELRDGLTKGEITIGPGASVGAGKQNIGSDMSSSHGHGEEHGGETTSLAQSVQTDDVRRRMSVPESPGMSYSSTSASSSPPTTPQLFNYPSTAGIPPPSDGPSKGSQCASPSSSIADSPQLPSRATPFIQRKLNSVSKRDSLSSSSSESPQEIIVHAYPSSEETTPLSTSLDRQITPTPLANAAIMDVDGTNAPPTDDSDASLYPISSSPMTPSPPGTQILPPRESPVKLMSKEELLEYHAFLTQRAEDVFPAARALAPTPHPTSTPASTSTSSLTRRGRRGSRDDGVSDFSWEAASTAPSVRDEPVGESSLAVAAAAATTTEAGTPSSNEETWPKEGLFLPATLSSPEDLALAIKILRVETADSEEIQNVLPQDPPASPPLTMLPPAPPPPTLAPPPPPIRPKSKNAPRPPIVKPASRPSPMVPPPRVFPPSPAMTVLSTIEDEYLPDFLDLGSDSDATTPFSSRPMGIISALSTVHEDLVASPGQMRSPTSSHAPSVSTVDEDEDENDHAWADPIIPRQLPRKAASMGDLAAGAGRRPVPLLSTHSETQVPTTRARAVRQVPQPRAPLPPEAGGLRSPVSPGTGSWRGPSSQAYMQRGYERPPLQTGYGKRESVGDISFDFRRQSRHAYGVRDIAYALLEGEGYGQASPAPTDTPARCDRQNPLAPDVRTRVHSYSTASRSSISSQTSYASHPYGDHSEPPASPSPSTSIPARQAGGYTPGVSSRLADTRARPRPPALAPIVARQQSASELALDPARERILRRQATYFPLDILPSMYSPSPFSPSPSLPNTYAHHHPHDSRSYLPASSSTPTSPSPGVRQAAVRGSIVDIGDALALAMDRRGSPSVGERKTENLRHKVSMPGLLKPMPDLSVDYSSPSKEAFPLLDPPTPSSDRDRSSSPHASLASRRSQSNATKPTPDGGSFGGVSLMGPRGKSKLHKSKKEELLLGMVPPSPTGRLPPQVSGKAAKLLGADVGRERELTSFIPSAEEKVKSYRKGLFGMMRWG